LVPARGGSRGLPRKNVLTLANKPLIGHVLDTLAGHWDGAGIIVMTDDDEIASIAERRGARVLREAKASGQATLDDVALEVCKRLAAEGATAEDFLITVQPTCPFIKAATIQTCIDHLAQGARTVLTVTDDRRLRWTRDAQGNAIAMYEARLNRQALKPVWRETGGVIAGIVGDILKTGTRIQSGHVAIVEVDEKEAVDIDGQTDFLIAQHYATRRKAAIRADGSHQLGVGHVQRAVALAAQLVGYDVEIVTRCEGAYALGHKLLSAHAFALRGIETEDEFIAAMDESRPDIVFLDILNTAPETISALRRVAGKIVTFEDLGEGAGLADLVVNDLYASPAPEKNTLSGVENALLSTAFDHVSPRRGVGERVENLLVLFGGTDPSNLTEKALSALKGVAFDGHVTLVLGPGRADRPVALADYGLKGEVLRDVGDMAAVMSRADLALSSAGRTVTELMTMGVPALVLCQNRRELLHTHASMPYGVMNLGLGSLIDLQTVQNTLRYLLEDRELRARMNALMLRATANRDNRRIVRRIERMLYVE
jgi:spore coat polysaccharide biosynthesis predicted glycosyltransferase SpsG/CMP-N-acetylneuraminic acid synthetase